MNNIQKEIVDSIKIAFIVCIGIVVLSKLGLNFSWLVSIAMGAPISLIVAIIIFFVKNTQFNDR